MPVFRLREWQTSEPIGLGSLTKAADTSGERLAELLKPIADLRLGWDGTVRLQAGRHVGELAVGELLITVEPHLTVPDLFALYAWTEGVRLDLLNQAIGQHAARCTHLLEAIALGLVVECERILRGDLHRAWTRRDERLLVLRGSPRFDRIGAGPPALGIPCRYLEGTRDTAPNRLLAAGLISACRRLTRHPEALRRARPVTAAFCDLATPTLPDASDFTATLDRLTWRTEPYRPALQLSRWLLLGGGPLASVGSGGPSGWHLDMAALFESAVTKAVAWEAACLGLRVRLQPRERRAIMDAEGRTYREVRPDIEVLDGNRVVVVVDAKYKRYAEGGSEGAPVRPVSNDDIYQLAFYGAAMGTQPQLVIVAPTNPNHPLGARWCEISLAGQRLHIVGVDLAKLPRGGAGGAGIVQNLPPASKLATA